MWKSSLNKTLRVCVSHRAHVILVLWKSTYFLQFKRWMMSYSFLDANKRVFHLFSRKLLLVYLQRVWTEPNFSMPYSTLSKRKRIKFHYNRSENLVYVNNPVTCGTVTVWTSNQLIYKRFISSGIHLHYIKIAFFSLHTCANTGISRLLSSAIKRHCSPLAAPHLAPSPATKIRQK